MKLYQWAGITLFTDVIDTLNERNQYYLDKTVFDVDREGTIYKMAQRLNKFNRVTSKNFINYTLAPMINRAIRAGNGAEALDIVINRPDDILELEKYKEVQEKAINKALYRGNNKIIFDGDSVCYDVTDCNIGKNYNGVINIGKEIILNKYLKEDIYENIGGIVENNYMTLTNNYIYLYDIKTNKINKIKNIVDMANKVEVLNIEDGKAYIKNIDDRTYYIYNNKTKKIKSTYKYQFQTDKNINKKHKDVRLYKIGEYYYYTDNNIFYRSSIYNTKEETILFELENSSYKISNKGIILLKDNEAYIYTNEVGLRLIARSNEFRFHANNMIEIYK